MPDAEDRHGHHADTEEDNDHHDHHSGGDIRKAILFLLTSPFGKKVDDAGSFRLGIQEPILECKQRRELC